MTGGAPIDRGSPGEWAEDDAVRSTRIPKIEAVTTIRPATATLRA